MPQVVAVGLDGAERDAAEAVDLENMAGARGRSDEVDVGFFARADLGAEGGEGVLF